MPRKAFQAGGQWRRWLVVSSIGFFLSVSLLSLAYLWQDIDWTRLRQVGPLSLLVILGLSLLSTALYTWAIHMLLRCSGYHVTFLQAYLLLTASLSVNYVTPLKAGLPLRIYFYDRLLGIAPGMGTALVTLETLIGMATAALAATLGIIFLFADVPIYLPLTFFVFLSAGIGMLYALPISRVTRLLTQLPWRGVVNKLERLVEPIETGIQRIPFWALFVLAGFFTLSFVVHAVRLYVVLHVFGYPLSPVQLFFVLTISVTAGNVSMLPMGLGVRDASFVLLLLQLGLPNEIALSTAVIQRLFTPGWPMLLGFISLSVLGLHRFTRSHRLTVRDMTCERATRS